MDTWTHDLSLRRMGIELPEKTLDRIVQATAETEKRLRALGPSYPELRTLEDGRKVTATVQPAGSLDLALALVDSLWKLYLPHFGSRLMDLAAMTQWHFRSQPLMWFSEDARQRLKEHKREIESQPHKHAGRPLDSVVAGRRTIVAECAGKSDLEICKRLDLGEFPMPPGWAHNSWVAAYRSEPQKIHNLFSRDRSFSKERGPHYSE